MLNISMKRFYGGKKKNNLVIHHKKKTKVADTYYTQMFNCSTTRENAEGMS